MRVIVAGSRTVTDIHDVLRAISNANFPVTELVSGGAHGADALGEVWAKRNHLPITQFFANWRKHGRAAGPIRNRRMAEYADALVAVWDGESRGTLNMIEEMKRLRKPFWIERV